MVCFTGKGTGDLNIKASWGIILIEVYVRIFSSEIYSIEDCKFYANSITQIKNSFIKVTSVSGRTIYLAPFTFDTDVSLLFKFKNNPPSSWVIGFGSDGTTINNKAMFFKIHNYNFNKLSIMWLDTGGVPRDAVATNSSISKDTVFNIYSENNDDMYWKTSAENIGYRATQSGSELGLRLDVFDNMEYEIDYVKVKPL